MLRIRRDAGINENKWSSAMQYACIARDHDTTLSGIARDFFFYRICMQILVQRNAA
jgi:hypothetical protein